MIFEAKTGFRAALTLFQSPFFCFPDAKMAHVLVSFSLFLALQEKPKKLGTGGFEPINKAIANWLVKANPRKSLHSNGLRGFFAC